MFFYYSYGFGFGSKINKMRALGGIAQEDLGDIGNSYLISNFIS